MGWGSLCLKEDEHGYMCAGTRGCEHVNSAVGGEEGWRRGLSLALRSCILPSLPLCSLPSQLPPSSSSFLAKATFLHRAESKAPGHRVLAGVGGQALSPAPPPAHPTPLRNQLYGRHMETISIYPAALGCCCMQCSSKRKPPGFPAESFQRLRTKQPAVCGERLGCYLSTVVAWPSVQTGHRGLPTPPMSPPPSGSSGHGLVCGCWVAQQFLPSLHLLLVPTPRPLPASRDGWCSVAQVWGLGGVPAPRPAFTSLRPALSGKC